MSMVMGDAGGGVPMDTNSGLGGTYVGDASARCVCCDVLLGSCTGISLFIFIGINTEGNICYC